MKSASFGRELHVRAASRRDLPVVMVYTTVSHLSYSKFSAFPLHSPFLTMLT